MQAGNAGNGQSKDDSYKTLAEVILAAGFGWPANWVASHWAGWGWWARLLTFAIVAACVFLLVRRFVRIPRTWLLALAAAVVVLMVASIVVDIDDDERVDDCERQPSEEAVDVMVVWERPEDPDDNEVDELAAFCAVTAAYQGERHDVDVAVRSVGQNIGAALTDAIAAGDPPDVAIIPQPSLVRRLGADDHLVQLNHLAAINHGPEQEEGIPLRWTELASTDSGGVDPVWGAFVKGANKSLFWYLTEELADEPDPRQGWEWDLFTGWIERHAGQPDGPAPLTLAAESPGLWPLTDWFENQLALVSPELYQRLASGDPTVAWDRTSVDHQDLSTTLAEMADLWGQYGVLPTGDHSPTRTAQGELDDRLRNEDAALVFHPSFLAGPIDNLYPDDVRAFRFPGLRSERRVVVGGDIAVVPREGDPRAGTDFVDWLTSDETAMVTWSDEDPGYLVPNWSSPQAVTPQGDEEDLRERLTNQLLTYGMPNQDEDLFFDLSDDQFATRNEDDPRATWRIFDQFFREVVANGDRDAAIEQVVACLRVEYTGEGRDVRDCP